MHTEVADRGCKARIQKADYVTLGEVLKWWPVCANRASVYLQTSVKVTPQLVMGK